MATFDPDDFELQWPPRLFVDELNRLLNRDDADWAADIAWLLTEAFVSTAPAEQFQQQLPYPEDWLSDLIEAAASWPEPGTRKPYWSRRTGVHTDASRLGLDEVTRSFVQLINQFDDNGYLAHAFGQTCVDDRSTPLPDPASVLTSRLGYPVSWPLGRGGLDWALDQFADLVEVLDVPAGSLRSLGRVVDAG